MIFLSLAFLLGDVYLQTFSQLPDNDVIYLILFFCLGLYAARAQLQIHARVLRCILSLSVAFLLGWCWSAWYANHVLSWTLPKESEGVPVIVTGYITSLPRQGPWQSSFIFYCDKLKNNYQQVKVNAYFRLACRDSLGSLTVGDQWQFLVKLKRIHGISNPGSFDYEAYSLQQGVRATGSIVNSSQNKYLSHTYHFLLNQIRQHIQQKLLAILPKSSISHWLMALTIGEKNGIPQKDWEILRKTGTNHLMAIAGLHIGMIAGFTHVLVNALWSRVAILMFFLPAQFACAMASLIVAILYSALAGFSIPTLRACLMLAVFIFALLIKRKINAWSAWSFAMMLVLVGNPLTILAESFWLSFGTLALIIYGMSGRLRPESLWWKWGRVQWVIGIGIIPLTLYFFQEASLISFVANTLAIPWLGFFILPFCFLGALCVTVSSQTAALLLWLADMSLTWLWATLDWLAHCKIAFLHLVIPHSFLLVTTVIASILFLLPAGMPGRWLGIVWLLPLFFNPPVKPKEGDFWLTVLDVGQGLSAVIRTSQHTLLYDTGAKLGEGFDMGASVVLPYLRIKGIEKLAMLVVSHGDNDHIGGANTILNGMVTGTIKTSVPEKFKSLTLSQPISISYCFAKASWTWDGVTFKFLHPTRNDLRLGNDSSCVLRISNNKHTILLTGDIEKYAEKKLLKRGKQNLKSSILVAPHHGSKTSGLSAFINAVNPSVVIYPIGYRNRYHFPHPSVVKAYDLKQARQFDTAKFGAITFELSNENTLLTPKLYRIDHQHYWYEGGGG